MGSSPFEIQHQLVLAFRTLLLFQLLVSYHQYQSYAELNVYEKWSNLALRFYVQLWLLLGLYSH